MNTQSPISTIIPTKNGHATIVRAVQSALDQTLRPDEILIISDHDLSISSEKESAERLQDILMGRFSDLIASGQIRIIQGEAKGPGIARNLGVSSVKTSDGDRLIAFLDDDDIWNDATKLEKQAAYLAAHPEIDVVGAETAFFIDENANRFRTITQPVDPDAVRKQMLMRNPLMTSSVLMRKAAFDAAGGFKHMYLAEDYDLWLRINKKANRIANVSGTSIEYTVRTGSASQKRKIRMAWTVYLLVLKYMWRYPNRIKALLKAKLRILKSLFA